MKSHRDLLLHSTKSSYKRIGKTVHIPHDMSPSQAHTSAGEQDLRLRGGRQQQANVLHFSLTLYFGRALAIERVERHMNCSISSVQTQSPSVASPSFD
jgi:hypothetical protein